MMNDNALEIYRATIGRYPIMMPAEETELLKGWDKARNRPAIRRRMIEGSLRFAAQVAMEMYSARGHISIQDAIAEANVGLIEAASRFDPAVGSRFITYAVWWVRQAVSRAQDESHTVKRAHSLLHDLGTITATQDTLRDTLEREPTDGELIDAMNEPGLVYEWTPTRLRRVRRQAPLRNARFDDPAPGESGPPLADRLPDEGCQMPGDAMAQDDMGRLLEHVSASLSGRERMVLVRHHGLDGEEPEALGELGDKLGVSRERVRQIEQAAREKVLKRHGRTLRRELA